VAVLSQAGPRWWRSRRLWLVLLAFWTASVARAQLDEYQVKAAFLYNFAKFVDWPAQSFHNPEEPIAICTLGSNPFGDALERVIGGKTAGGRPLLSRRIVDTAPPGDCHILFAGAADVKKFRAIVSRLRGTPTLTVGESPEFIAAGGMINFKIEAGKIRFEINVQAAEQGQLHISSKLLSLAEVVKP